MATKQGGGKTQNVRHLTKMITKQGGKARKGGKAQGAPLMTYFVDSRSQQKANHTTAF